MADWRTFFREVRAMFEASADLSVELTIDQIRDGACSVDRSLDQHWWWDLMMDPHASSHKGVLENRMECEAMPAGEPVERVVFRVRG